MKTNKPTRSAIVILLAVAFFILTMTQCKKHYTGVDKKITIRKEMSC